MIKCKDCKLNHRFDECMKVKAQVVKIRHCRTDHGGCGKRLTDDRYRYCIDCVKELPSDPSDYFAGKLAG